MKLYNFTQINDKILSDVLVEAGRSVGAKTTNVVVKVTSNKTHWKSNGTAYNYNSVYEWFVSSRHYTKNGKLKQQSISCDGCIWLKVPYTLNNPHDALERAEDIFGLAAHEFAHIAEYQSRPYWVIRNSKDKRKHHDNRPWEKTAIKAASKAVKHMTDSKQEAVLRLALHLEELSKQAR